MKPAPTPQAAKLRAKLTETANRGGTAAEREVAAEKLKRLSARYDWTTEPVEEADIFADFPKLKVDSVARTICVFSPAESDLAQWVGWIIREGTKAETLLRPDGTSTVLCAHVQLGQLKRVSDLAERIRAALASTWKQFSAAPGVLPAFRSMFLRGCYDGMMQDDRTAGQMLPAMPLPKKSKGKRQAQVMPAVHPYALALEIGRKLRLSATTDELSNLIESRTNPRLEDAA